MLGPVTEVELPPDDPLLDVPLPEDPLLEVPLPEDPLLDVPLLDVLLPDDPLVVPLLEVPVPEVPLLDVPLPEDPLLEVPLLEVPLPDDPLVVPLLEVPVPEVPLLEVPVPEDPLLEVPLLDVLLPDDPLVVPLLDVPVPEVPLLEVPVPEDPLLEVPLLEVPDDPLLDVPLLPEEPVLEVPLPDPLLEVPLLEVPLLDVPLLEVPVLEVLPDDPPLVVLLPDDPLWGGVTGIIPPPHPTRKIVANSKALVLSMNCPCSAGIGTDEQIPLARKCGAQKTSNFRLLSSEDFPLGVPAQFPNARAPTMLVAAALLIKIKSNTTSVTAPGYAGAGLSWNYCGECNHRVCPSRRESRPGTNSESLSSRRRSGPHNIADYRLPSFPQVGLNGVFGGGPLKRIQHISGMTLEIPILDCRSFYNRQANTPPW